MWSVHIVLHKIDNKNVISRDFALIYEARVLVNFRRDALTSSIRHRGSWGESTIALFRSQPTYTFMPAISADWLTQDVKYVRRWEHRRLYTS